MPTWTWPLPQAVSQRAHLARHADAVSPQAESIQRERGLLSIDEIAERTMNYYEKLNSVARLVRGET
eukprot:CAMPEP_0178394906 /NCGR_PEP_ID=MMETSP0689_2-20121128/12948_1 /TAXON_ID=160604 /ORGANISM="Amphidinium massartii, Strain CS-259" /LENGTH=66 /DNA_ID=CAMNT_0020015551 /DNA_START=316 /DNA_END=516 /DNA_ORIENTATION=-